MPMRIRAIVVFIFWIGAFVTVLMIATAVLTFEIADSVGRSWIHKNSMASLGASLIVYLVELILTASTDGKSRTGAIACSCFLLATAALLFLYNAVEPGFVIVTVVCMLWNLLLLLPEVVTNHSCVDVG